MEHSATTQARRRQDPPLLDVQDLAVRFKTESGEVDAVKDVSFRLYKVRPSRSSANPAPASR